MAAGARCVFSAKVFYVLLVCLVFHSNVVFDTNTSVSVDDLLRNDGPE